MGDWMLQLVKQLLVSISPEIRQSLVAAVTTLEEGAKKTPNPWDDIFVGILKYILNIK